MSDHDDKEFRDFLSEIAGDQPVGSSGEAMDYTQIEQPEEIIVEPSIFDMLPYEVRELVDSNPDARAFANQHPNFYVLMAALLEDSWLSINMSMIADSNISEDDKREQLGSLIYSAMSKVVTEDEELMQELKDFGQEIAEMGKDILITRMLG